MEEPRETEESSAPIPDQEAKRSTVYSWEGDPVLMSYHSGPYLADLRYPYEVARGPLEGRQALFVLKEVDELGVIVQRILDDEDLAEPVFMPWSAVHSITPVGDLEEDE